MTARKIDKLEQRLYRTIKDIREASTPREVTEYIRQFGRLEHQYVKLTGSRFSPVKDHEELQDVEWRY
jgi:hypothetical protein